MWRCNCRDAALIHDVRALVAVLLLLWRLLLDIQTATSGRYGQHVTLLTPVNFEDTVIKSDAKWIIAFLAT